MNGMFGLDTPFAKTAQDYSTNELGMKFGITWEDADKPVVHT